MTEAGVEVEPQATNGDASLPEIPALLPVLPLKETVVFPESMTPLAIGQERSVKLIEDVVAGERRRPKIEGAQYQQMELDYGTFQRQIRLGEPIDVDATTATYERGLLRLVLPIAPAPPPRDPVAIEVTRS